MDMIELAKSLEEFRTALGTTGIPDDKIDLIVGAAGGVALVLMRS
jgi:hypothetical protein